MECGLFDVMVKILVDNILKRAQMQASVCVRCLFKAKFHLLECWFSNGDDMP